jgi:protease IV
MRQFFRVLGAVASCCGVLLLIVLTFAIAKAALFGKDSSTRRGHVAVIELSGIIVSSSSFLEDLRDLQDNPGVKAIVVRLNTPGGVVGPSQEIYQALKEVDKKTPVVASMGTLAASAGYLISLSARKIYANPGTLTASIGVIMEFANLERLYDWAKIQRYVIKSGKFKDIGSETRKMTPEEKELINRMILDIYGQFRGTVKERRKLTEAELDAVADGRVLSGNQAKQAKLIDSLGTIDDAIKEAKKLGGLPDSAPVVYPDSKDSLLKKYVLGSKTSQALSHFDNALGVAAEGLTPGWQVLMLAPFR